MHHVAVISANHSTPDNCRPACDGSVQAEQRTAVEQLQREAESQVVRGEAALQQAAAEREQVRPPCSLQPL